MDLEAEIGDRLVAVLGNHDAHLLALADGLGKPAHRRYLADVLDAEDGERLVAWLRLRPLLHHDGEHLLVHAGLLPGWRAEVAIARARRAEQVLGRPGGLETLLQSNGNRGEPEAAETFAVLTRIRMMTAEGELCGHTGPPESAPPGCVPWFDMPGRKTADGVVVAGHWAALGRRLRPDLLALDSGCVYGGKLTAVRLEDRQVFEQPNRD